MKPFLIFFFLIILCHEVSATNLRGQIVRFNPSTQRYFPLGGVRVDFWAWNGAQWIDAGYFFTGQDGLYYFSNVNPGTLFKLSVGGNFYPPQPLTVTFINYPYFQDIPYIAI